jgi:hypothetical protein
VYPTPSEKGVAAGGQLQPVRLAQSKDCAAQQCGTELRKILGLMQDTSSHIRTLKTPDQAVHTQSAVHTHSRLSRHYQKIAISRCSRVVQQVRSTHVY